MTYQRPHATLLVIAVCLMSGMPALAQSTNPGETANPAGYEVTQITGLLEAKPNSKGQLVISDTDLLFTNGEFKAEIPFTRMTAVSIGNERIETGGKTGRVARTVIPFGGGLALATVTQKSVDLLTIEYLDRDGGYHGVVFVLPKVSAKVLNDRMQSRLPAVLPRPQPACEHGPSKSTSVVIEPIASSGVELPAEYRVLLYEGLVNELRAGAPAATYVRAGSVDADAGCPAMKLSITVTGFKKGNQAVRAATGPVGLFVGKTSVSFHVELTAADGRSLLAKDMTNSNRTDTDSLGVAKSAAKAVSRKIRKLPADKSAT